MIRPAVPSDEADIRTCIERAYTRYVAAMGRRPAPMDADIGADIAAGHAHVAIAADGRFQGFIVFLADGNAMLLDNVAVMPSAAGQGVGRALIRFCEAEALSRGFDRVRLYTNEKMVDNLAIYPRLGYAEIDRRTENGFNRVYFEKILG